MSTLTMICLISFTQKTSKTPYHVPLHYSDSFEMILFKNAKGQVTINGNSFPFDSNQVFVIPPDIVPQCFCRKVRRHHVRV